MNDNQTPETEATGVPEEKPVKPKRVYRKAVRTPSPFASKEQASVPEKKEAVAPESKPLPKAERDLIPQKEKNSGEKEDEIARIFHPESADQPAPVNNIGSYLGKDDQLPDLDEEKKKKEKKEDSPLSPSGNVFDWIKSFLFSLAVVIFIFTLLFRGVNVNGGSMLPTLENNEYLIISDLFYTPKTGDIVVVQSPTYKNGKEPLIKRIIATGGQTVKINFTTWEVWVDGVLLEEDYILKETSAMMNCEDMERDESGVAEVTVKKNCIFVMGDHRNDSLDSRSEAIGQIDQRYIMGRVILRVTPLDRFGKVN